MSRKLHISYCDLGMWLELKSESQETSLQYLGGAIPVVYVLNRMNNIRRTKQY
jgi:hypothetical protein